MGYVVPQTLAAMRAVKAEGGWDVNISDCWTTANVYCVEGHMLTYSLFRMVPKRTWRIRC
jgi:hypothetical protein